MKYKGYDIVPAHYTYNDKQVYWVLDAQGKYQMSFNHLTSVKDAKQFINDSLI